MWWKLYTSIVPLLINAVKHLAAKVSETAHLVIERLTAKLVHSDRVETQELCVDDVCVTRDQFAEVFGSQSAAAGAPSVGNTNEAPSGPSAPMESSADTTTTTTSSDPALTTSDAWLTPEPPAAANDNPPPSEDLPATGTE